jgi:hypothetical protein
MKAIRGFWRLVGLYTRSGCSFLLFVGKRMRGYFLFVPLVKLAVMKKTLIAFSFLTFLFVACNNDAAKTEDKAAADTSASAAKNEPAPANDPPLDSATMAKNWQEYMTPGEIQKMVASWDGTWNGDMQMWMAPGAPPTTNKTVGVNKMVMGGRYQINSFKGSFNGMPFEGMGTLGYDNHKKIFQSTWIDNMSTGVLYMQGSWDEASKSMTLTGKSVDPTTKKEVEMKQVYKVVDENTHLMEMYGPGPDGKEYKTMEIKLTRKK